MNNKFFEHPILNSPYDYPNKHWELDSSGQPTQRIEKSQRQAEFITPIPKPRKEYHLWLRNRQALYGVQNLLLAPGYTDLAAIGEQKNK